MHTRAVLTCLSDLNLYPWQKTGITYGGIRLAKQKCKATLVHECFSRFRNLWKPLARNARSFLASATRVMDKSFKAQSLRSFVSCRHGSEYFKRLLLNVKTYTKAYFRKCIILWKGDFSEFWQVWMTAKEACHELGGRKLRLRSTSQNWFRYKCPMLPTWHQPLCHAWSDGRLSRMKWRQISPYSPYLKSYKTCADVTKIAWKKPLKKSATDGMELISAFKDF